MSKKRLDPAIILIKARYKLLKDLSVKIKPHFGLSTNFYQAINVAILNRRNNISGIANIEISFLDSRLNSF